jgi:hypothetical protein
MKLELNKVYKDREGNQWKTVLYKEGFSSPFMAVNKNQNESRTYTLDGYCTNNLEHQLVEVIGDDFKEEPFKIEFEGSILYSESTWNQETITVAAHKKADFNFEIAKSLHKFGIKPHNCKITIEEIVE